MYATVFTTLDHAVGMSNYPVFRKFFDFLEMTQDVGYHHRKDSCSPFMDRSIKNWPCVLFFHMSAPTIGHSRFAKILGRNWKISILRKIDRLHAIISIPKLCTLVVIVMIAQKFFSSIYFESLVGEHVPYNGLRNHCHVPHLFNIPLIRPGTLFNVFPSEHATSLSCKVNQPWLRKNREGAKRYQYQAQKWHCLMKPWKEQCTLVLIQLHAYRSLGWRRSLQGEFID